PGTVLPQRWLNNEESFLAYMEEALKGIRGTVLDAVTHEPVRSRIDVIDISNVPVFTDSTLGDYHRLLLPGTYSIIARAAGYVPDTMRNVVVTDSVASRVDFLLQRERTTAVQDASTAALRFELSQNYPNPFNPATIIKFQIPNSSFVTLKVFDLLGREVATLVNEQMKPGSYERTFEGNNLASGIYFYHLRASGFSQTKKLVLLR
ncbi:MAG: T9SS type A sorting domain-containing protein, partial [Bacteroidota bacterium]